MESLNQWVLVTILLWPLLTSVLALVFGSSDKVVKWGSDRCQPTASGLERLSALRLRSQPGYREQFYGQPALD